MTAGDLAKVQRAIIGAKRHFGIGDEEHTLSCYEAGRDGFWLHRYLHSCEIDNVVVDSASLEVNRRCRGRKPMRAAYDASAFVALARRLLIDLWRFLAIWDGY